MTGSIFSGFLRLSPVLCRTYTLYLDQYSFPHPTRIGNQNLAMEKNMVCLHMHSFPELCALVFGTRKIIGKMKCASFLAPVAD